MYFENRRTVVFVASLVLSLLFSQNVTAQMDQADAEAAYGSAVFAVAEATSRRSTVWGQLQTAKNRHNSLSASMLTHMGEIQDPIEWGYLNWLRNGWDEEATDAMESGSFALNDDDFIHDPESAREYIHAANSELDDAEYYMDLPIPLWLSALDAANQAYALAASGYAVCESVVALEINTIVTINSEYEDLFDDYSWPLP